MGKPPRFAARLLVCGIVLILGMAIAPAHARLMEITFTGSGLTLYGIPLPAGAEPTMAANMPLEGLHAMAPGTPELGKGHLRAVVFELQVAAPPDAVADFYQRELGRKVELAARPHVDQGKALDNGIRLLSFQGSGSYLAIHAEDLTRPSRITVVLVQGSAGPAAVLRAVEMLRAGEGLKPAQPPALLSPPHWEAESHFEGAQLEIFKRQVERGTQPGPVVDVRRSLLREARSLNLQQYHVERMVPPGELLAAFHQEACRLNWQLVSVDAQRWPEVVALYRFPNDTGMVMLRAGPAESVPFQPPAAAASTEITRLEVAGPINFSQLFQLITLRKPPRAVPSSGPPPPHPSSAAPVRGSVR